MSLFTLSQVAIFGAEQEWKPQNKRAYKRFVKRFALPRPTSYVEQIMLSQPLALAYEYLADAPPEERAALAAMPDQIEAWYQMKARARIKAAASLGGTRRPRRRKFKLKSRARLKFRPR